MTPEINDKDDETNRRANEKSAQRKAARDKIMATKTHREGPAHRPHRQGQGQIDRGLRHGLAPVGHGFRPASSSS